MTSPRLLIALSLILLTLSACTNLRESLGLGRSAPDEFSVVDRPPLSLPPDFGLRPPQPGMLRPQEVDQSKRASEIVFGGTPSAVPSADSTAASDSEKALLTATNAAKADPNIREIVDHEDAQKVVASKHLVEQLLWWKRDEKPGVVVDPVVEAERIKEAKEKGEPLNQTPTAIIERQKTGWLDL